MRAWRKESGYKCGTTRGSLSRTPSNKNWLVSGEKFDLFSFQQNEQEERDGGRGVAEQADGDERNVEKWKKERKLLIDVFTVKKSTGESEVRAGAGDLGHSFGQMSWDRDMKYYFEPLHKRPGLKWIQTTNETEHIFKAFRLGDHLRELAKEVRAGIVDENIRNRTQTLWAPRVPKAESHDAFNQDSKHETDVEEKLDAVVTKKLQELYQSPREREDGWREQAKEGVETEIDCDPDARCKTESALELLNN